MPRPLPSRPNLEHLRSQAKNLLAQLRDGNADAARMFSEYLPEAAGLKPEQVRGRGFRLADAQTVVAHKNGFAGWPFLARHVGLLRSMEGTWAFRSLQVDGQEVPASMLAASFLLLDGDRFRMESPEATYEGIFNIDVEKTPHTIDIDFVEGPEAGNRSEGLFELEGDQFRLCLGLAGAPRPRAFATSPGSGHALEDLVRVDKARPPQVEGGTVQPMAPVVLAHGGAFDAAMSPTLEALQGEWTPLELVTAGKPLPDSYLAFGSRTQTGVETKVVFGGQTMVHAQIRFHEGTEPLEVDYLSLAGKGKGAITRGLFRWEGEVAVFCVGAPGAARPDDFTCESGSGRTFSRWRRKTS